MSVRHARSICAGLALVALLANGAAAAETNLKFSLDRKFEGPSAPFPADAALEPIKRVASGAYDMAFADINALIRFRDANPNTPIKAVFMLYNKPAYAVIGRKSRGVTAPKDLEGKKLGVTTEGNAFAQWPIFVKANGIDASKVTIENVSLPVRDPLLAAGQVDAITGLSFSSYIDLKDKGVPVDDVVVLLMADYGVKLYGNAIIVSAKFAETHPEVVKAFLRAFLKGLKTTVKSPASALGVMLERIDASKKSLELERLKIVIRDNILTPEVKAEGYGGIDTARFAAAIDQITLAYKFKSAKPKPTDIFDASFLPPADQRKVN